MKSILLFPFKESNCQNEHCLYLHGPIELEQDFHDQLNSIFSKIIIDLFALMGLIGKLALIALIY